MKAHPGKRIAKTVGIVLVAMSVGQILGACREWQPAPGATLGEDIYRKNCVTCHGVNGGGADGPSLISRELSPDEVASKVRAGGAGMRSFEGILTSEDIQLVSEYVASLSQP